MHPLVLIIPTPATTNVERLALTITSVGGQWVLTTRTLANTSLNRPAATIPTLATTNMLPPALSIHILAITDVERMILIPATTKQDLNDGQPIRGNLNGISGNLRLATGIVN